VPEGVSGIRREPQRGPGRRKLRVLSLVEENGHPYTGLLMVELA
jgi:hypothetical protein